jgi:membrane protease YdiL (CAAX protease family)
VAEARSQPSRPKGPAPGRARRAISRLSTPHDALTSLVLTLPVFLVYHVGIVFMDLRNGADFVTGNLIQLLDLSVWGYLGVTFAVAACLVGTVVVLRKKGELHLRALGPVVLESVGWAALMWLLVGWATARIVPHAWVDLQIGGRTLGPLERLVMSAGAGFYEELVFRVGLFGGLAHFFSRQGVPAVRGGLAAAFVSALLFSAVHYLGSLGDAFSLGSFVFRTLSGLYLCALFRFRGFAVAVYAHALYDVAVFFLAGT